MIQIHPTYHNKIHTIFRVLFAFAFIQLIIWFIPDMTLLSNITHYSALHTLLELVSIIISAMIFMIVWTENHNKKSHRNNLILASAFLAIAILDLMHTLSYPGMPDFFSTSTPEKAINFWLLARYISAIALLSVSLMSWQRKVTSKTHRIIVISVCLWITSLAYVGLFHEPFFPDTYIAGEGLTPFKIYSEYVLIALFSLIALRFYTLLSSPQAFDVTNLFAAVCLMAMSELFFTKYSDVTDIYNLLGHVYKLIAYFYIYRAIFVATIQKPYEELQESRNLLNAVIEAIPMRVFWKDSQSRYLGCNTLFAMDAGEKSPKSIIDKFDDDLVWREQAAAYKADDKLVMTTLDSKKSYEEIQTTPTGEIIWLRTSKAPIFSKDNAIIGMLGVYDDISRLKQAEIAEKNLTRARALLSKCSTVLIHADNEKKVMNEVCRLTVEVGGYMMAWIGLKEDDHDKRVRPIAYFGCNADYLNNLNITWSDTALGQGPTGKAIRTASTIVNDNSASNDAMKPWRDNAIQHAFNSSIAIPMIYDNQVLGALSIYASQPEAFSKDEISLLEEMTNELAYGIHSIRTLKQKRIIEDKIKYLAFHDVLTNLPNRTLFLDRFHQAISHSKRTKTLLAVCFLDLDNFKPINDNFGHGVGDKLLIEVANRLTSFIREEDTVSRQGGDEFVLLLGNLDSVESCRHFLTRMHERLAEPFMIDDHTFTISASSGATIYPLDDGDADTLLRHADNAMYQSKMRGKNCSYIFDIQDNMEMIDRHRQISEIEQALIRDEFCLYYQPKVEMKTGKVFGVEALIRWEHPERGLIPPSEFLPLVSNSLLEIQIGNWVIRQALQQLTAWNEQDIDLEISINIASFHLLSPNFISDLAAMLEKCPVDASRIQIELLESSVLSDIERITEVIRECQDQFGISFALDDFGTGYSSLTHVRNLTADVIKMDQSFVRDILDDPDDYTIIDSIIGLANSFKRDLIAEGVETVSQGLILLTMGCDKAQGYSIAKPMPSDELITWLAHYVPNTEWLAFEDTTELNIENRTKTIRQFKLVSQLWYKLFKAAVESEPANSPVWPTLDKNQCHHGVWINRLKHEHLFDPADIANIDELHSDMHEAAANVYTLYQNGDIDQARLEFTNVQLAYDRLTERLNEWLI